MIEINVFNDSGQKPLPKKQIIESVRAVFTGEKRDDVSVSVILTDNQKVRELGKKFLSHDYDTDVITFDLTEEENQTIEGEIYIAVPQAAIQAKEFKVSLKNELKRLAIHGALHLCGYNDAELDQREKMREMENKYILF